MTERRDSVVLGVAVGALVVGAFLAITLHFEQAKTRQQASDIVSQAAACQRAHDAALRVVDRVLQPVRLGRRPPSGDVVAPVGEGIYIYLLACSPSREVTNANWAISETVTRLVYADDYDTLETFYTTLRETPVAQWHTVPTPLNPQPPERTAP